MFGANAVLDAKVSPPPIPGVNKVPGIGKIHYKLCFPLHTERQSKNRAVMSLATECKLLKMQSRSWFFKE